MPFIDFNNLKEVEIIPGYKASFIHTGNYTLSYWNIEAGAEIPEHPQDHHKVSMVIKGKFKITIDGQTRILEKGMVAIIPPNTLHSAKAITDCEVTDIFYPEKEEYKFEK